MKSPTGQTATRNHLAAVSASTGELLPWNPAPDGTDIRSIAVSPDGGTVYVGGTFTKIGGANRTNAAALSAATGQATAFVANTNATVRQIRFIDGRMYMVGSFWRVNNLSRGNGAEVDPTTGSVKAWNPQVTAGIITVAGDVDGIYIGGYFTKVNSVSRDFSAKVDKTTGALLPWTSGSTCQDATNPCYVWDILPSGDTVYLASGGPGGRIVSLSASTGFQNWWSGGDGDFTSVLRDGNKLYAAGHFTDAISGYPRAGIVVLDASTGAVLTDFTSLVVGGSGVWQLILNNGWLRASGQFSTVDAASIGKYVSFPVLPDPADTQPPAQPGTFRAPAALSDQVTLNWAPAADDVATTDYRIIRDGNVLATSNRTTFKDRTVAPGTQYTYTVEALDAAGNVSPQAKPITVTTEADTPRLLQRSQNWAFLSMGDPPAAGWTSVGFDQSAWGTGAGEFGFGDGDEDTYISPRGVAHYFRTTFDVADRTAVDTPTLRMLVDDGAVVYLNGEELLRTNMPTGTITNTSLASSGISGSAELVYNTYAIPAGKLINGKNQIAVEVHNQSASSSDISFDAFITYTAKAAAPVPTAPGEHRVAELDPGRRGRLLRGLPRWPEGRLAHGGLVRRHRTHGGQHVLLHRDREERRGNLIGEQPAVGDHAGPAAGGAAGPGERAHHRDILIVDLPGLGPRGLGDGLRRQAQRNRAAGHRGHHIGGHGPESAKRLHLHRDGPQRRRRQPRQRRGVGHHRSRSGHQLRGTGRQLALPRRRRRPWRRLDRGRIQRQRVEGWRRRARIRRR
jgi:hypothetical protein